MQVIVELLARGSVRCTQLEFGALLVLALAASCVGPPPRVLRARIPAPTMAAPDTPALANEITGTLTAVHGRGAVTVVDLPTRRERKLEIGQDVTMVAGPDEAGRIVYEAESPRWWEFFPLTLFTPSDRRHALMVCSLRSAKTWELYGYRPHVYTRNQLLISRRGGRVVYIVDDDLRVYDLDGRKLLQRKWDRFIQRNLSISEDGDVLCFERLEYSGRYPSALEIAYAPCRKVCLDIATGVEAASPDDFRRPLGKTVFVNERSRTDSRGPLLGDLGEDIFELASGLTFYEGLASPRDGARAYRTFGPTECSVRLGQRATGKTLSLVRCFEPGAWCYSDVRVDPKLLSDPAPPRR